MQRKPPLWARFSNKWGEMPQTLAALAFLIRFECRCQLSLKIVPEKSTILKITLTNLAAANVAPAYGPGFRSPASFISPAFQSARRSITCGERPSALTEIG